MLFRSAHLDNVLNNCISHGSWRRRRWRGWWFYVLCFIFHILYCTMKIKVILWQRKNCSTKLIYYLFSCVLMFHSMLLLSRVHWIFKWTLFSTFYTFSTFSSSLKLQQKFAQRGKSPSSKVFSRLSNKGFDALDSCNSGINNDSNKNSEIFAINDAELLDVKANWERARENEKSSLAAPKGCNKIEPKPPSLWAAACRMQQVLVTANIF